MTSWRRSWTAWWRERWALAVLLALTAALYLALSLELSAHLLTEGFDLGVYYDVLRGYAHLQPPIVPLKGLNYDLLGDHFEPLLAALVPTYWLWPDPRVLLVDQALLMAASLVQVWMYAERRFPPETEHGRVTVACLVGAYALSWELQSLVGYDFHSLALAVPLIALAVERADAGRWRVATVCALALLLVKEDMALVVAAFGIYVALMGRRRLGLALVVIGSGAFILLTDVVIPFFAGGRYAYWTYRELGPGPGPALLHVLRHPLSTLRLLVTPREKAALLGWTFVPTGLLSLVSPVAILAVPLLLDRLLSTRAAVWGTSFQYSAPLAPVIALAAIDGLHRLSRRVGATNPGATESEATCSVANVQTRVAVVSMMLLGAAVAITAHFPLSLLFHPSVLTRPDPQTQALTAAERLLPHAVMVAATATLVPPLLNRNYVVYVTTDSVCGNWVLADTSSALYPYASVSALGRQLTELGRQGWRTVYDHDSIALLHRTTPPTPSSARCLRNDPLLAPG